MKLTEAILRKLAGEGNIFPVGSTREGFEIGVVPGLHSLKKPVDVFRYDGFKMSVSLFSDSTCQVHQNMVRAAGRWEPMTSFFTEDPYAGLARAITAEDVASVPMDLVAKAASETREVVAYEAIGMECATSHLVFA